VDDRLVRCQVRREERLQKKRARMLMKEEKRKRKREGKEEKKRLRQAKRPKSDEDSSSSSSTSSTSSSSEDDKKIKKEEKREWKRHRKEHKAFKKCYKKHEKREKKGRREKCERRGREEKYVELSEEVVQGATSIFLDGNNMLYLTSALRKLTLSRNVRGAEALLEAAARKMAWFLLQRSSVQEVVLIFDETSTSKSEVLTSAEGRTCKFVVCSARPDFPTSDHALVAWAQTRGKEAVASCLFATSDRALADQLAECGAKLVFPKRLLRWMCGRISSQGDDSGLDSWLDELTQEMKQVSLQ
jgi:hypothetical protein